MGEEEKVSIDKCWGKYLSAAWPTNWIFGFHDKSANHD